ncbi:MAG: autotransporter-associated beta strand repeat-containing protein, partial [Deltaproteobacteria bacterium]|nr:autotransporter-associated beta strand repeat-containing protein [Deltaproteobacteria bacterium]
MPAYSGNIWDGEGANPYINTANNWDGNVVPALDGTQLVTFGTGGAGATINTNGYFLGLTINRDSNFSIAAGAGNLTIGNGGINAAIPNATSRIYTISEGLILAADQTWTATNNGAGLTSLTVSGAVSGAGRNLTVGGTGNTFISGVIGTGAGGLSKTDTGTLTLSGANTYSGGTTLAAGTLSVANNAALGTGTLELNGGTLTSSSSTARTLTNSALATGDFTLGQATGGTGALTLSGTMDLGVATRQITVNNAADTISGVISGTGGLTKTGTGTLSLYGANTYSGGTIVSAGALQGNATSLQGDITNNAYVVFNQTAAGTYAGNISGTGRIAKTGAGTLTLAGANTYTGTTTISAGTLSLGADNALSQTTALTLANTAGATLDLNSFNQTIGSLAGGGTTGGNVTLGAGRLTTGNAASTSYYGVISGTGGLTKTGTGTLSLYGANTYTGGTTVSAGALQGNAASLQGDITNNAYVVFNQAAAGTYAGNISGTGRIAKTGAGTLTLAGANNYAGTTTISAGTLSLGADNALSQTTALTLANTAGATLDLSSFNQTIGSLAGGGTTGGNVTLGAGRLTTGNAASTAYAGVISGTGGLVKTGTGTLTLSGANTYSGGATLAAGTLSVANNAALGTGTLELNGGTLTSSSSTARTLTNSAQVTGDFTLGQATGGTGALTLSGAMDLGATTRQITVNNAADTISGVISGAGGLTKAGIGTLILSGANTYSGGTTVSAGTLQGHSESLQGEIANNAAVIFNQTTAGTYAGDISGTGRIAKTGAGTLTLAGANTYTGTTTISAGTLSLGADNAL